METIKEEIKKRNEITLYRFERFEDKRLNTIKSRELWFSQPNKFNDLNDCNFHISEDYDDFSSEPELITAIATLCSRGQHPLGWKALGLFYRKFHIKIQEHFKNMPELIDKLKNGIKDFSEILIRDEIKTSTGICCFFSVMPYHPLMWAHYANNHQGFCTEYTMETDTSNEDHPYRVNYTSDWPIEIDINELVFSPKSTIKRITTSKGIDWAYEKEYRFVKLNLIAITNKDGGVFCALPKGLKQKRIIAGANVKGDNLQKLKDLATFLNIDFTQIDRKDLSNP